MSVTVNDANTDACWICNDPNDHGHIDHAIATGDGLSRYDIVRILNANGWGLRPPQCRNCGEPLEATEPGVAFLCGPAAGTVMRLPSSLVCNRPACRADRDAQAIAWAIEKGIIDP